MTQIITIAYRVPVVAAVVLGLRFGVRVTVALYAFEQAPALLEGEDGEDPAPTPCGCPASRPRHTGLSAGPM